MYVLASLPASSHRLRGASSRPLKPAPLALHFSCSIAAFPNSFSSRYRALNNSLPQTPSQARGIFSLTQEELSQVKRSSAVDNLKDKLPGWAHLGCKSSPELSLLFLSALPTLLRFPMCLSPAVNEARSRADLLGRVERRSLRKDPGAYKPSCHITQRQPRRPADSQSLQRLQT